MGEMFVFYSGLNPSPYYNEDNPDWEKITNTIHSTKYNDGFDCTDEDAINLMKQIADHFGYTVFYEDEYGVISSGKF